jgi:hypothetical protein
MIKLLVILSFAGLIAGVIACVLGWRGRRVGDELRCPRCEFDVTSLLARTATVTCPECALAIKSASEIRRGTRLHRRGLLGTGIALMLCFAPLALIVMMQNNASTWLQQRKPAELLAWEWMHGPPLWRARAANELLRRDQANVNVDAQLAEIGRALLPAHRADRLHHRADKQIFDIAFAKDLLPRQDVIDLAFSIYGVRVEIPAVLRQSSTLPVTMADGFIHSRPFAPNKRSQFARTAIHVSIEDEQGNVVGNLMLDGALDNQFEGDSTWIRPLQPMTLPSLPVGAYRLCGEARSYYFAPWTSIAPVIVRDLLINEHEFIAQGVPSKTFPIDIPFRIVDESETLVTLNTNDAANDRMLKFLQQSVATLRPGMWGKGQSISIEIDSDIPSPKEHGVYTVQIEQGENVALFPSPKQMGTLGEAWDTRRPPGFHPFPTGFSTYTDAAFTPGRIRVTFTPAPRAAERLVGSYTTTRILGQVLTVDLDLQSKEK